MDARSKTCKAKQIMLLLAYGYSIDAVCQIVGCKRGYVQATLRRVKTKAKAQYSMPDPLAEVASEDPIEQTDHHYWDHPPDLHKLLRLIETSDICPTYEQMQAHLGWKSKSGVWKALTLLERLGYIRKMKQRRQAIEPTWPKHLVWHDRLKMLVPMLDDAKAKPVKALEAAE